MLEDSKRKSDIRVRYNGVLWLGDERPVMSHWTRQD
jgi:hypothetical protein